MQNLILLMLLTFNAHSQESIYSITEKDLRVAYEECESHSGVESITPSIVRVQPTHYTVDYLYIKCNDGHKYKKNINEIRRPKHF